MYFMWWNDLLNNIIKNKLVERANVGHGLL